MSILSDIGTKIGAKIKELTNLVNTKLDVNATAVNANKLDGIDSSQFKRKYVGNIDNISSAGYTTILKVIGTSLASEIKINLSGTTSNVVVNVSALLLVNHSKDIYVRSESGNYTQITLKVLSDNNENFYLQAKTNNSNALNMRVEVSSDSNDNIIIGNYVADGSTILEHTCFLNALSISTTASGGYYFNGSKI